MGLLDKIKGIGANGAANLIEKAGETIDRFVTTKSEAEGLKIEMAKVVNAHAEKMAELQSAEIQNEDNNITERWKADATADGWLSKNTRPLVMLSLLGFLYIIVITDSTGLAFEVKEGYIDLLTSLLLTTVVAYFGSRGVEKYQKIKSSKK